MLLHSVNMCACFGKEQQNISRKYYYPSCVFCVIESLEVSLVQDSDGNKVVNEVIFGPGEKTYRYCKVCLQNLSAQLFMKCSAIYIH
jgi:hypothetical protein